MSDFNNKRVVITGATGLIGYNLTVKLLQDSNALVVVTGRNKVKLKDTFKHYLNENRLVIKEHDAASPFPEDLGAVDYFFHAAGPIERDVVMNKPVNVLSPNILGTINCLEYLKRQEESTGNKGRMVVFSSVTVYNNNGKDDYVAVEEDTTQAISLDQPYASYAESKRMIEVIARSYNRQFGVDVVIARFSTVYGYTPNIPDSAFYEFIRKTYSGENIILNSSCLPRRDNIYVDDAVEGLVILALNGVTGESYNISSNGEKDNYLSIDEIADRVIKAAKIKNSNCKSVVEFKDKKRQRSPGLRLDNSKLKQLGWKVITDFTEGVYKTMQAFSNKN